MFRSSAGSLKNGKAEGLRRFVMAVWVFAGALRFFFGCWWAFRQTVGDCESNAVPTFPF